MSVLTVSQLNNYIAFKIKCDTKLKNVLVEGEISNFTSHYKSGHMYFTLKDSTSSVKAVMFSSNASRLKFMPNNGMGVIVSAGVDVFERDGVYQLYVTDIQPSGIGGAYLAVEQLKNKLEADGLFNEAYKKPIPLFPKKIGVVTSSSGAALHDIINVISRRCPIVEINVYPAIVQGENSAYSISEKLKLADLGDNDVIIVGRGGGSLEDLSAFNSEAVARSIFQCKTPVISAVGHETDVTIADFVSDLRAPTPSAAAELAVPEIEGIKAFVASFEKKLFDIISDRIEAKLSQLSSLTIRLNSRSPENTLNMKLMDVKAVEEKLKDRLITFLNKNEQLLNAKISVLNSLNPLGILSRGYSLTYKNETLIKDAGDVKIGDEIKIKMSSSEIYAAVLKIGS
ncbi:MAG: exodeoxyribonuclease VII large subunit [Oscillospiraceae bacterium]